MRWLIGAAVLLAGCEERVEAYVECNGSVVGYQCKVTHQKVSQAARVCWSVSGTCANGRPVFANGCATVQPAGFVTELIPVAQVQGIDSCDQVTSLSVNNVRITKGN